MDLRITPLKRLTHRSASGLRRLGRVVLLAALTFFWATTAEGSTGFTTEEVCWNNGDIKLVGTLYLPDGNGPFPTAVMLHGSGSLTKTDRIYREHAERMAQAGLAFLVYDKRGVGSSTGNWRQASLTDLADDAEGAVNRLRTHKKIITGRIGLVGISQGAWVANILLSRPLHIAFIVWVSGAPITPAEQGHFVVEAQLRAKGYDAETIKKASDLDRRITAVYRTNSRWEEATEAIQKVSSENWFKDSGLELQAKDFWHWQWYRRFMDYDPMPVLKRLNIPLFVAYGEEDQIIPVQRCAQILDELRTQDGKDITTIIIPNLGHDLSIRKGPQPEAYWAALETWLRKKRVIRPASAG